MNTNPIFSKTLCIWDGKDGFMLIEKLQSIIHKVGESYIFKLLLIMLGILLVIFAMLESQDGKITFVYNNF